jgi:phosphoenolpyruvate carboxylase
MKGERLNMALADKLNQVKSEETPIYQVQKEQSLKELESLLTETNELNKLMQSYIRVQLNEDTMKKVTVESELESMKKTSQEIQGKMVLILQKLENTQKTYADNLLQAMATGKTEMTRNNQEVLNRMSQIERTLKESSNEMERSLQNSLSEVKREVGTYLAKAKKETLIYFWLDALKYGLSTSVVFIPLFLLIKYLLGLLGIQL